MENALELKRRSLLRIACYAALAGCVLTPQASAAEFFPIPQFPDVTSMAGQGVSEDGQVVVGIAHQDGVARGFRWSVGDAAPVWLNAEAGGLGASTAVAASFDGGVIVGQGDSVSGPEGHRWQSGVAAGIGDLDNGFYASKATDVSSAGDALSGTGHSMIGREAFRWTDAGGLEGLGFLENGVASEANGISGDGSVIVGFSETFDTILGQAFRWTEEFGMEGLGDLPGGYDMSHALAVSYDGSSVVGTSSSSSGMEAFRWNGAAMEGLGDFPGGPFESEAYGASNQGLRVVGMGFGEEAHSKAFVWESATGMRDLRNVLANDFGLEAELDGWQLLSANAITSNGSVIVGTGLDPFGRHRAWRADLDELTGEVGDFNGDQTLDVEDVNVLQAGIRSGQYAANLDLNADRRVDEEDLRVWVHDLAGTYFGDADLDGMFGTNDLVIVFQGGEYEDNVRGNSTWAEGDWDGDGDFLSADIIRAFQDGGYERGPRAAVVPEPSGMVMGLLAVAMLTRRR